MTQRTDTDFKINLADLTKIPPNEFEKHFHDWMQRDDVARELQAKLRCDLIKNFNKTNLGKHIISHTMSASGGSSTRLTLSPLILALNTLVAEFLYAQNCHFTLSVFCTEIPFRNTLPDFESVRDFRFNNNEIAEIWEAVTGSAAISKNYLNKHLIKNYETNPSTSLLLLIIKCLLEKPVELLRKSVEIQTETRPITHQSTSVQTCVEQEQRSPIKSPSKDDNLHQINNYLLILSEKVIEMTKEFENFSKHRNLPRPIRSQRSSRCRDYVKLNKSLERITENMKHITQSKRKNKRLSNIVESIDNLTKQFGKCAQNFDNVTQVLRVGEQKLPNNDQQKPTKAKKVSSREKQTETESQEKSYADWIHEMRTTTNGQKFLDRVEISLRKALTKYREQLQNETDIKIKHLKSVMKLHYQQKLSKYLLQQDPKESFEDNRKLNQNIETKLETFEMKQMELMQQLKQSSFELQEAQKKQKERAEREEEKPSVENVPIQSGTERIEEKSQVIDHIPKEKRTDCELKKYPDNTEFKQDIHKVGDPQWVAEPETYAQQQPNKTTEMHRLLESDTAIAQTKQIQTMVKTIAEHGRTAEHIIYDAKLRMQQLESEGQQLEQNFQSYLERRKREQLLEHQSVKKNIEKLHSKDNLTKIFRNEDRIPKLHTDVKQPESRINILQKFRSNSLFEEEENDEEFTRMKETLQESKKKFEKSKGPDSDCSTSSIDVGNAILEAKLKFFDQERNLRKSNQTEVEIQSRNRLQKELENYRTIFEPSYYNQSFEQYESETNINNKSEFNHESNLSQINIKNQTLDEYHERNMSPIMGQKSDKLMENKETTSARRNLFAKEAVTKLMEPEQKGKSDVNDSKQTKPVDIYASQRNIYHEPILIEKKYLKEALKDLKNYADTMDSKKDQQTEATSKVIKQSMAKMQQLFEESTKETINEMEQRFTTDPKFKKDVIIPQLIDNFEKSLSTTTTSTTTITNTTTATSTIVSKDELYLKSNNDILKSVENLNHISNISIPSMLDISSESEEGLNSAHKEPQEKKTKNYFGNDSEKSKEHLTTEQLKELANDSDESYQSSEYKLLPTRASNGKQKEDSKQELGQYNQSVVVSEIKQLPPVNDMEIGEIISESKRIFAPIEVKLSDSSSETSSILEMSTGHQNKRKEKHSDDSGSDFWA